MQILKWFVFFVVLFSVPLAVRPIANADADAQTASDQYAGDAACLECHDQISDQFGRSTHGMKSIARSPAALSDGFSCESCHGPGAAHAEEGGGGNIRVLSKGSGGSPQELNDLCLKCHTRGKTAMWENSTHDQRSVSCMDCHSIHGDNPEYLSQKDENQLCISCHPQIRSQQLRLSHHPIREGKLRCSDCHNVHGAIAENLIDAPTVNQKCYQCHPDIRGPHLWQHEPVVEDCMICHTPHGASQESLLNAKVPYLCQRCHSNVDHSGLLQARNAGQNGQSAYRSLSNLGFYRGCLNCHSSIHGSNHPSGKSLLR